ncbi:MAG TPA: alpha/beta hydrolase [Terriglobales bacterium]|nr:alpha/beta hydrolase [Terriglobales bacterium]
MANSQPVLDPRTQWFLNFLVELKRPQIFEVLVEEARAMFLKGQQLFAVTQQPATTEDHALPVGPKGSIHIRIFKPEGAAEGLPVLMYFHGGGWVLGDCASYDRFMRETTNGTGSAIVFVEYSRSPEERYPVPLEECYAATKWVAEHGNELGLDTNRIAVAGDSAGGNMAAVVCMLAKERGGPSIAAQVLIYPATGSGFDTPSFKEFAEGYYLTAEASRWFWHQYAPDRSVDKEPTACPLLASLDQLKDLPPALVITAECDILRDEGEAYARKLTEAGVPVTCTRFLGAIHGFMGANALAQTPAARAATTQMNTFLKEALAEKAAGVSVK